VNLAKVVAEVKRIVITGSRTWTDKAAIREALAGIKG
jgi:hypothetical protein